MDADVNSALVQILLFLRGGDFYSTWGSVGTGAWTRTWTRAWQYFDQTWYGIANWGLWQGHDGFPSRVLKFYVICHNDDVTLSHHITTEHDRWKPIIILVVIALRISYEDLFIHLFNFPRHSDDWGVRASHGASHNALVHVHWIFLNLIPWYPDPNCRQKIKHLLIYIILYIWKQDEVF